LRIRAGGRCLGYSADTEFDPGLISWLAEADLVVHDTGFGIHASPECLAELPSDLRRKLRLAHYPDNLDPAGIGIEPLEEGTCLEV
jgi:ribonuclease BN (tRNA processing enzyme)